LNTETDFGLFFVFSHPSKTKKPTF